MYSAFYWEEKNALEEISTSSIVMQQTRTAGKRVNLYVLAVSGKKGKEGVREAGEFTHGMVQWFHRDFLMKMDRGRKGKQLRNNAWKIIYERAEKLALNKKELSFGYILLQTVSSTFAINAGMPPMLAAWIPNITFAIVAYFCYRKAPN